MGKCIKGVNDLYTWCLTNGDFGQRLLREWTGLTEDGKEIRMSDVARASGKKVLWRCEKGHEWIAMINNRVHYKTGCPYCAFQKVSEQNNLEAWCLANPDWGEQLSKEWTGRDENGNSVKMREVTRASNKRVLWRCAKGHEWLAQISNRVCYKTGCPYCAGQKVSEQNSLEAWCLANPDWGEQLSKEWTGKDENGNSVKMSDVTRGSGKKVLWRCEKGHEWIVQISHRTSHRTGCPYCNNKGTSFPEQYIYHSLKQIYPKAINRGRALPKIYSGGIEFDIAIPEEKLVIEYSATYWHAEREKRDQLKRDICKQYNVRYIEIIDDTYNELEHKLERDYICFKMNKSFEIEILKMIVKHILQTLGHSINEIDLEKAEHDTREAIQLVKQQIA